MSLFDSAPLHDNAHEDIANDSKRPLAERMRPDKLDDFRRAGDILARASRCARRSSAMSSLH